MRATAAAAINYFALQFHCETGIRVAHITIKAAAAIANVAVAVAARIPIDHKDFNSRVVRSLNYN